MAKLRLLLLSAVFLSQSTFAMEMKEDISFPTENTYSASPFGSWMDLRDAQVLFEDARYFEASEKFSRLWEECGNLVAFGYLKDPLLKEYLSPDILREIATFEATDRAKQEVKISKIIRSKKDATPEKLKIIRTVLESIVHPLGGGRVFYELFLLEQEESERINLYIKALIHGYMGVLLSKEILPKKWQDFIKTIELFSKQNLNPGDLEYRFASNLFGGIDANIALLWFCQASDMGNLESTGGIILGNKKKNADINSTMYHLQRAKKGVFTDQISLADWFMNGPKVDLHQSDFWFRQISKNSQLNNHPLKKELYSMLGRVFLFPAGTQEASLIRGAVEFSKSSDMIYQKLSTTLLLETTNHELYEDQKKQIIEAAYWFEKAADCECDLCAHLLALISQHFPDASSWISKSDPSATLKIRENKVEQAHHMFIEKDHLTMDRTLIFKIAYQNQEGVPLANYILGKWYKDGLGGEYDYAKAIHYYEQCAFFELGELRKFVYAELGNIYEIGGYGVAQDYKKALENYQISYHLGLSEADCHIGGLYDKGSEDFPQDIQKAHSYFKKAAKNGNLEADFKLILHFLQGYKDDDQTAEKIEDTLRKNAEKNHRDSKLLLGMLRLGAPFKIQVLPIKVDVDEGLNMLRLLQDPSTCDPERFEFIENVITVYVKSKLIYIKEKNAKIERLAESEEEKGIKETRRQRKEKKDIEKARKNKERHAKESIDVEDHFDEEPTEMNLDFTERELKILEQFSTNRNLLHARKIRPFLDLLSNHGAIINPTKGGFSVIAPELGVKFGMHPTHRAGAGNNTLEGGRSSAFRKAAEAVLKQTTSSLDNKKSG